MKDIKFRVWNNNTKRYESKGFLTSSSESDKSYVLRGVMEYEQEEEEYGDDGENVVFEQQWSPSEGILFFTGDLFTAICSASGSNNKKERICKVSHDGRGMGISVWYKNEWRAYSSMNFTTVKVIGNIHENPELLCTSQST